MQQTPFIKFESFSLSMCCEALFAPFSCAIHKGEMVAFLGDNGVGKSSLFGLLSQTRSLCYEGVLERGFKKSAYIPQAAVVARHFPLTVRDVLAMAFWKERQLWSLFRTRAIAHMIDEALDLFALKSVADAPIAHLSGGQFQKTLCARAFLQKADIWLLDEVFSAMDEASARAAIDVFARQKTTQGAVALVMHDEQMARAHCHQIIYLSKTQSRVERLRLA